MFINNSVNSIKKYIKYFFLFIFCFLYVFQPVLPFVKYPIFLSLIALIYLAIYRLRGNQLVFDWLANFKSFLPFFIYIIISLFFHFSFGIYDYKCYIHTYISILSIILHLSIGITFILTYIKKHFDEIDITSVIIGVVVLQFICSILAYIFLPIKLFFDTLIILYSNNDILVDAIVDFPERSYGFAGNLFDLFGAIIALLLVFIFINGLKNNNKLRRIIPFVMLFMVIINTRTGVLLSLLGFGISFIYYTLKSSNIMKILKNALLFITLLGIMISSISFLPEKVSNWFFYGIENTCDLVFYGKTVGVYSEILGADLNFIPDDYIFGEGIRPYDLGRKDIDNGFMQALWLCGYIGIILYFYGVIGFFIRLYRLSSSFWDAKCICICYPIIYIFYNFKLFPWLFSNLNFILFALPLVVFEFNRSKFLLRKI